MVAQLAATLRVERGAVQDHLDLFTRPYGRDVLPVAQQPDHVPVGHDLVVAGEVGGPGPVEYVPVGGQRRDALFSGLRVGLGAVALFGHQAPESGLVDAEALFGRHLQGEFDRESVGVVQGEDLVPAQLRCTGLLGVAHRHVEHLGAGLERLQEDAFFGSCHRFDPWLLTDQFRILGCHRHHRSGDELLHARVTRAEHPHVADDPPHQAAKDVTAALVARHHSVIDQEGAGAGMVGHDPQVHVVAMIRAVALASQVRGDLEDGFRRVDLVDVVHALQQGRHALQPHAGVDVLGGQVADDRVPLLGGTVAAHVLHEDEVPDLEVAVLVDDRATLAPELGAAIVVDLRTGAARARNAHGPEVVGLSAALDPVERQPDLLVPDVHGLVVVQIDSGPQAVRVEAVTTRILGVGEQFPGVGDRQLLEVVAEREVAGHLEERRMPRGLADLVDVEGAHYLLHGCRPRVGRRGLTQEVRLEGDHAGVDEQQGGIVHQQRRGRDHDMLPFLEERQKARPDLSRVHPDILSGIAEAAHRPGARAPRTAIRQWFSDPDGVAHRARGQRPRHGRQRCGWSRPRSGPSMCGQQVRGWGRRRAR